MSEHDRPDDRPTPRTGDEAPTERLEGTPTERLEGAPTERLEGTPTERLQDAPTEQLPSPPHQRVEGSRVGPDAPHGQGGAHVAPEPYRVPEPPSGPHAPTILMALICLAIAGLAIARQVTGFIGLTWSGSGPAIIVGAGVVLLAVGVLGLLRDRRSASPYRR